jgi:signal transduction histidine kinase
MTLYEALRKLLHLPAARISLLYLIVAGAWVFLSDQVLAVIVPDHATFTSLGSIKGVLFVVVMAALLYFERLSADRASQRASDAMRQTESKYRAIFETAPVGIFRATPDGHYLDVNSSFARMLGYATPQELIGADDAPPPGTYGPGTPFPQAGVISYERKYWRNDGRMMDALVSVVARADSPDGPMVVEGYVEDITERKGLDTKVSEQQATLRNYAHQLLRSQEDERKRLSRELHDEPLQDMVGLAQRIELARRALEREPASIARRLEELQTMAREMIVRLRRISNDLRPFVLEDLGIVAAVQYIGDELAQQMPACVVQCDTDGDERRLDPDVELTVFRIIQQAAYNVRTHAGSATHVRLKLTFEDSCLAASVQDDGPGFTVIDTQELLRQGHLGIAGMQERASLMGGSVSVSSAPNTGTTVHLQIPYHYG